MADLHAVAQQMVAKPRGILAMDESNGTAGKRLMSVNMENTEENRRKYRQMLVTTKGLGQYISGAIMFSETLYQKTDDGKLFVDCLKEENIIPGIKTDIGLEDNNGEKLTKGLDDLDERNKEFAAAGAQFAKWRAVIMIGDSIPTDVNVQESARRLAAYAKSSQDAGLVPIVEPEVIMDGDHTLERCAEVTTKTLKVVYAELDKAGVDLKGTVLKPNMIVPGKDAAKATPEAVAKATIDVLKECVPADVPGIAFLSGGISDADVTDYLNAMNALGESLPWNLTFSFGRGLQRPALTAFATNNIDGGQEALLQRAKASSDATVGKYA